MSEDQAVQILKEYASNHLESYEWPAHYVVVDKLPLTTVGKVDYRKLEQEATKEEHYPKSTQGIIGLQGRR